MIPHGQGTFATELALQLTNASQIRESLGQSRTMFSSFVSKGTSPRRALLKETCIVHRWTYLFNYSTVALDDVQLGKDAVFMRPGVALPHGG